MKRKLKRWQKTLIGYTAFLLIIAIVSVCFYLLAVSPDVKYGIKSGIIEHSEAGTDITESIIGANSAVTVLKNDNLTLNLTPNGNIEVVNNSTGKVWSSQVEDAVQANFRQGYNSTHSFCEITYVNDKNAEATYTSYDQCIQKKQLRIYELSDNTVRLDFILGVSNSDQLVPTAIEKERFEKEILPKLDENDQEFMKRQYLLYDADELTADDNPDELYKKYPNLKKTPIYISGNISGKVIKEKLMKVFEKIGYTAEDYDYDNQLTGYGASSVTVTYKIVFDLTLDGNDLIVNVPKDEIEFFRDYPMLRVSLMKFLMSSVDSSSVLIPSGSGAIAEFVPGKSNASFSGKIYGEDNVFNDTLLPTVMNADPDIAFPVMAMRDGTDTVTAIIESGDSNADIKYQAVEGGMNCYFEFTVLQSDRAYINTKTSIIQCGNDVSAEDIRVRYRFGEAGAEETDEEVYSAVAADYREYLKENKVLGSAQVDENPVLLLDIIGSVGVKKDFLGLFPVDHDLTLTDFDDAGKMVDWFTENGADNLSVNLSGWNKGGLYRQTPGKTDILGSLGGNSGFKDFTKSMSKIGIDTYLSAVHTVYFQPSLFGYSSSYTSSLVDGSKALLNSYTAVEVSTTGEGQFAVISPKKYTDIAKDYISSDIKSLSIGDLASTLNSDYGNDYHDRSRTKAAVVSALKRYEEEGVSISANKANMYALSYVDRIEELSTVMGNSSCFDSSFPFCQIVLHGSVNYTSALDLSRGEDLTAALEAIRTGSGLKAVLSHSNSDYEFKAYYSYLFATDYKNGRSTVARQNQMVKDALSGLQNVEITAYTSSGELSKTQYADGTVIYVNTGNTAATFDTYEIEAMSYLRIN